MAAQSPYYWAFFFSLFFFLFPFWRFFFFFFPFLCSVLSCPRPRAEPRPVWDELLRGVLLHWSLAYIGWPHLGGPGCHPPLWGPSGHLISPSGPSIPVLARQTSFCIISTLCMALTGALAGKPRNVLSPLAVFIPPSAMGWGVTGWWLPPHSEGWEGSALIFLSFWCF